MVDVQNFGEAVNSKAYWEQVHKSRSLIESGWYQEIPKSSLDLITSSGISKTARIIDIGGGDSLLADHLLNEGFENITVLDISESAIEKAKSRLGPKADRVTWICSDVKEFTTDMTFDLWHDRACLHFLMSPHEIEVYREKVSQYLLPGGFMVIGAFSKTGPSKCSGLSVHQYSIHELTELFSGNFHLSDSFETIHGTPSNASQNYVFCRFKNKIIT